MAITNYTELKTAVGDWLHHGNLGTKDVDFITLCEARINRDVRLRAAEEETNLSISASSRTAALPSGFIEPIDLYILPTGYTDRESMVKCAPDRLHVSTTEGQPYAWTVDGDEIAFDRPFDSTSYTVTLRYVKKWDIATDTTNWLLTNYPDLYLWGAVSEGAKYLKNNDLYLIAEANFKEAIATAKNQSRRTRKQNLKSDLPRRSQSYNGGYDIRRG